MGVLALAACSDSTGETSTVGAGTGGAGGSGGAATTTGGTGGAPSACEAYCDVAQGCKPDPDCVTRCEGGTSGPCAAEWAAYTACLAGTFDATTCEYDFHPCEATAQTVMTCEGSTFGLTQCHAGAATCDCSHAEVGTDFGWSCTPDGNGGYDCDCTHDGVSTGMCNGNAIGTCESGVLYVPCCLSL